MPCLNPQDCSILCGYKITRSGYVHTVALVKIQCPFCQQEAWASSETSLKAFETSHQKHCKKPADRQAFVEFDQEQNRAKGKSA